MKYFDEIRELLKEIEDEMKLINTTGRPKSIEMVRSEKEIRQLLGRKNLGKSEEKILKWVIYETEIDEKFVETP
jgi:tRNA C32,U32 (ribose-2'-O)-methylase TrmJ